MKTPTVYIQPKLLQAPLIALALASLLSGCNSERPTVAPANVQTLSGQAVAIAGKTLNLMGSDNAPLGNPVPVASDGKFTVTLEAPDSSRLQSATQVLAGLPCTATAPLQSSDTSARGIGIAGAKSDSTTLLAATVSRGIASRHVEIHAWIYSDHATTLTGELNCGKATGGTIANLPVKVNVTLLAGWTPAVAYIDGSWGLLKGLTGSGEARNGAEYNGQWLTEEELRQQISF